MQVVCWLRFEGPEISLAREHYLLDTPSLGWFNRRRALQKQKPNNRVVSSW